MKNLFTLLLGIIFSIYCFGQQRAVVSKELRNISVKMEHPALESNNPIAGEIVNKSIIFPPEEEIIGGSRYDDQANASCQNRLYLYDDGTIGATWTRAVEDPGFLDRGTGYNYFDGDEWGPEPEGQIETERVGWPSYMPWGENGEMVVAHGADGLVISTRTEKGTGDWEYSMHTGPVDHEYLIWNRTISSGVDNLRIHSMGVTASTVYNGTPYEGLNGALVYSLSLDGGATWEIDNAVLEGMTSDEYVGFDGDTYNFAEPKGDIIAFTVGESWYDFFLMKSTDGGQTFEKTLIWEHPYPFYDPQTPTVTDTFYCVDGSHHSVIDNNGKVHVVFGINRALGAEDATSWFPFVDGVGYWNEDMPAFSNDLNALNPYGHPDSELVEDVNLIGWTQDVNEDGEITFVGTGIDNIGSYYIGLSSMVQIVKGYNAELHVIFSSVTETYDNGTANYRHLWARTSPDGGLSWGDFYHLTSDIIHIFDECVYPSAAANTDDNLYLIYQTDAEPGVNIWGTTHPVTDNYLNVMKVNKDEITGIHEKQEIFNENDISQNYPNPFSQVSVVNVNLQKATVVKLEVVNLMGQTVYKTEHNGSAGLNKLQIDAGEIPDGVYFYTVKAGDAAVTKKMIVE
jgi:hypothetical protein